MKRKPLPATEPVIDQELLEQAKRAITADQLQRVEKCSVCGAAVRTKFRRSSVLGLPPVEDQRVARFRSANRSGVASARSYIKAPAATSSIPIPIDLKMVTWLRVVVWLDVLKLHYVCPAIRQDQIARFDFGLLQGIDGHQVGAVHQFSGKLAPGGDVRTYRVDQGSVRDPTVFRARDLWRW